VARGDQIRVMVALGDTFATEVISADSDGRTVHADRVKDNGVNLVRLEERTRSGTVVRYAEFAAAAVTGIVFEHLARDKKVVRPARRRGKIVSTPEEVFVE
jgi:hypothetical protein